jgi:hypothetical protein
VRSPAPSSTARIEPDNELYDRGCDLVAAAADIRRAAESPKAIRAVPAVLGCIESALEELLWATALLEQTTTQHMSAAALGIRAVRGAEHSDRMRQGYANLQCAIADAQRAAAAARGLARRSIHAREHPSRFRR